MKSITERALPDGYVIAETRWSVMDENDRQTVLQILGKGGAVDVASAQLELPLSTVLLVLSYGDVVVGIGTIKQERVWYAERIQSKVKSGYRFNSKTLELGYVAVSENHRGKKLSGDITTALINRYEGALFATTDDKKMKCSLRHRGFERRGNEWKGERGVLSLWMRE